MTATSTVLAPLPALPVHEPAPTATPAPLVWATTHLGELPLDLLRSAERVPVSVLDVEPRLLTVRRVFPEPTRTTQRPVAAPSDPRDERRTRRRQIAAALAVTILGSAATIATVATALS